MTLDRRNGVILDMVCEGFDEYDIAAHLIDQENVADPFDTESDKELAFEDYISQVRSVRRDLGLER
jgi:hypothetical protein